ncbi:uncharacterized protein LOC121111704 isoform X2 [Gallus gallus]|uniref:uncharacterized protein LOC121111704 isoform X2 n=1 Tax=Gallus gallus TaxID=9031 RepID=UPI001AE6FF08|nr:uncharacterized protein LOC121111704 isoform X2 [Gallus gallus]XP_040563168.1 uncharacterized protein LOC121111704 isoform X2 [Gallus gallus]
MGQDNHRQLWVPWKGTARDITQPCSHHWCCGSQEHPLPVKCGTTARLEAHGVHPTPAASVPPLQGAEPQQCLQLSPPYATLPLAHAASPARHGTLPTVAQPWPGSEDNAWNQNPVTQCLAQVLHSKSLLVPLYPVLAGAKPSGSLVLLSCVHTLTSLCHPCATLQPCCRGTERSCAWCHALGWLRPGRARGASQCCQRRDRLHRQQLLLRASVQKGPAPCAPNSSGQCFRTSVQEEGIGSNHIWVPSGAYCVCLAAEEYQQIRIISSVARVCRGEITNREGLHGFAFCNENDLIILSGDSDSYLKNT